MIVADSITPKMNAQEYLEDAACEAELRQVLGGISSKEHAKDLDHENLLVLGKSTSRAMFLTRSASH